jgi:hypothetical protein
MTKHGNHVIELAGQASASDGAAPLPQAAVRAAIIQILTDRFSEPRVDGSAMGGKGADLYDGG